MSHRLFVFLVAVPLTVASASVGGSDGFGPEHAVSDPTFGPEGGAQGSPAVASDGSRFLAVWMSGSTGSWWPSYIRGAITTAEGTVGTSFPISAAHAETPAVAWGGSVYLVVWRHPYGLIHGARVSADGAVLDPDPIVIRPGSDEAQIGSVAVGWGGTSFFVVWEEEGIRGARVAPDGTLLDEPGIEVSATGWDPQISSGAPGFVVVWRDGALYGEVELIKAVRLDEAGQAIGPATELSDAGIEPDIEWNGTHFLVSWTCHGICATRLDSTGHELDPSDIRLSSDGRSRDARIAAVAGSFLVVWRGASLQAARVSADGSSPDQGSPIELGPSSGSHAAAASGDLYLVASTNENHIEGSRVGPDGIVLDEQHVLISRGPSSQTRVAVARVDGATLAAWIEPRAQGFDVYVGRVGDDGAHGAGVLLGPGSDARPSIATAGATALVTWVSRTCLPNGGYCTDRVRAARVRSDGTLIDPGGFEVSSLPGEPRYAGPPRVASDGSGFLVVWAESSFVGVDTPDGKRGSFVGGMWASYVGADGSVRTPNPVPIDASLGWEPAIAWNGAAFLVVWFQGAGVGRAVCIPTVFGCGYVAYVGAGAGRLVGTLVAAEGLAIAPVFTIAARASAGHWNIRTGSTSVDVGEGGSSPVVASDGDGYLVLWVDQLTGTRAARIAAGGVVMDVPSIVVSDHRAPIAATWDGSTYVLTWDLWEGVTGAAFDRDAARAGEEFLVAPGSYGAAVGADDGSVVIGYVRQQSLEGGFQVPRAFIRTAEGA